MRSPCLPQLEKRLHSNKDPAEPHTQKNLLLWAKYMSRHFTKEDIQMADKHIKRCLTTSAIGEMQFKTKRYHNTSIRMIKIKT